MDSSSTPDNPYVFWALVVVSVGTILLTGLNKVFTGWSDWRLSLRRVGSDLHKADLVSRDTQIENLSKDLDTERRARQADRKRFEEEMTARDIVQDKRDEQIREHLQWDWKVYNVLVIAGLLNKDSKPPPLH